MDIYGRPPGHDNVKVDGNVTTSDMCVGTTNDQVLYLQAGGNKRIKVDPDDPVEIDDLKVTGTIELPGGGGLGDILNGGQPGPISVGTTDATDMSLLRNGFTYGLPTQTSNCQLVVDSQLAIEASSQWLSGGVASINVSLVDIDITAGTGIIITSLGERKEISWGSVTIPAIVANVATVCYVDETSVIQTINGELVTESFTYDKIVLCLAVHPGATITDITNVTPTAHHLGSQVRDLASAIGNINVSGNVYFWGNHVGGESKLDVTSGRIHAYGVSAKTQPTAPNYLDLSSDNQISLRYVLSDFSGTAETEVDTSQWESKPTVLAATASNRYYIHRIYRTTADTHIIQYAQNEYKTIDEAASGIGVDFFDAVALPNAILRSFLIMQGNSDFTDSQYFFIEADKFGQAGAGGIASSSTSTLQSAYNNGQTILTGDSTGMVLENITAVDTDNILTVNDDGSSNVLRVRNEEIKLFKPTVMDDVTTLGSLTTTQRDALTPTNGMVIHNSTAGRMEAYYDADWRPWHESHTTAELWKTQGAEISVPTDSGGTPTWSLPAFMGLSSNFQPSGSWVLDDDSEPVVEYENAGGICAHITFTLSLTTTTATKEIISFQIRRNAVNSPRSEYSITTNAIASYQISGTLIRPISSFQTVGIYWKSQNFATPTTKGSNIVVTNFKLDIFEA